MNISDAMRDLAQAELQPGTARYSELLRNVAMNVNEATSKVRIKDYVLYVGRPWRDFEDTVKGAAAVRALGARAALGIRAEDLNNMPEALRSELFRSVQMLLCEPGHRSLPALAETFRKTGQNKLLALTLSYPDVYAAGFYAWAVGAEAIYFNEIFSEGPQYNPFWFTGRNLLMLNAQGTFEPTLALLLVRRGLEDHALARRCEMLVKSAEAKKLDASELQKALAVIRAAAGNAPPRFDSTEYRHTGVGEAQLVQWRASLIQEAGKLAEKLSP